MQKTYSFNSDRFEAALVALVQAFQRENPGLDYSCTMHDVTKVSIKMGKPKRAKANALHLPENR